MKNIYCSIYANEFTKVEGILENLMIRLRSDPTAFKRVM